MTFILVPKTGEDVQINAWNWRPTVEFLRTENVITSDHAELLACSGCGATVNADLAQRMAAALEDKLSTMKPVDRIRADLSVTDIPKEPQVFGPDINPDDIDVTNLYSATYDWLVTFKDFCKRCGGFTVY